MPRQMDCTARGKGKERVEEATMVVWGSSNSGSDDDNSQNLICFPSIFILMRILEIKICSRPGEVPPLKCGIIYLHFMASQIMNIFNNLKHLKSIR